MTKESHEKNSEVERSIHFMRIFNGKSENGKMKPFDSSELVRCLRELQFNDEPITNKSRHLEENEDKRVGIWLPEELGVKNTGGISHPLFGLGITKMTDLSQVEVGGKIKELNIGLKEGLIDITHFIIFDRSIIGIEYNHYGPRHSKLVSYLKEKSLVDSAFELHYLIDKDTLNRLENMGEVSYIEYEIIRSDSDLDAQGEESLGKLFEVAKESIRGVSAIKIRLKIGTVNRGLAWHDFKASVRNILLFRGLKSLKVKGKQKGGKSETLDLLSRKFIVSRKMLSINSKSRAIEPSSAFSAINSAYEELKPYLERAAGINILGCV